MADPKSYQELISTMKNSVDDGDLMAFATGHNVHIEFVNTFVTYLLGKISTGSKVFNKSDISDMLSGTYDADSLINVVDASGHSSVTSGWGFFQYKGGGTGSIANYQLLFKQENLASEVTLSAISGMSATEVQSAIAELKGLLDALGTGIKWKQSADLATTGNITLSGEQTIDGVLTSTSRVLVWQQTDASENGIYTTGAGAWTRTTDADTSTELEGAVIQILSGTTYGGVGEFRQLSVGFTLDVDDVIWEDVSGSQVPDASETQKGKAELATQTETNTGTDDTRIVTPLKRAVAWLNDVANTTIGSLNTTVKNLVGAINELVTSVGTKQAKDTGATNANIAEFLSEETVDSGKSWGTLSDGQNAVANKILDADLIQQSWEYWLANFAHSPLTTTAKEIIPAINELNAVGTNIFKSHTFVATNGQTDFIIPGAAANEIYKVIRVVIKKGTDPAIQQYEFVSNFQIVTTTVALDTVRIFPASGQELSSGDLLHIDYFNKASVIAVETKLSLSSSNKDMYVASEVNGENAPTGLTISQTPFGDVMVSVAGRLWSIGDGVKTKVGYFSPDGGTTAKAMNAIVAGDEFCWNTSFGGPILTTFDVNFIYAT